MEIGVRQAKAQLSDLLRQVQTGTEVVITDRGKPVARLSAIQLLQESSPAMTKGILEGWVTPPVEPGPLSSFEPLVDALPSGVTTRDLLNQDRDDD
jgi:prevent-host-death family protein